MEKSNKNLRLSDFKKNEIKNSKSLIGGNGPTGGGVLTKKPKDVREED